MQIGSLCHRRLALGNQPVQPPVAASREERSDQNRARLQLFPAAGSTPDGHLALPIALLRNLLRLHNQQERGYENP